MPFIQQLQQRASHPSGGTIFLLSARVFELVALKLLGVEVVWMGEAGPLRSNKDPPQEWQWK